MCPTFVSYLLTPLICTPIKYSLKGIILKLFISSVEKCECAPGYFGLSCETCDVGYFKSQDDQLGVICEKCNCNGHAETCHPLTGECYSMIYTGPPLNCEDYEYLLDNCDEGKAQEIQGPIQEIQGQIQEIQEPIQKKKTQE